MDAYLKIVQATASKFDTFTLTKVPRGDNTSADALAALASTSDPNVRRIIPVECIEYPSIEKTSETCAVITSDRAARYTEATSIAADKQADIPSHVIRNADTAHSDEQAAHEDAVTDLPSDPDRNDWRDEIKLYIADGALPMDRWAARRLRARCARYILMDGTLYRRNAANAIMHCVNIPEAQRIMEETHEGAGGNHSGGRALAIKIKRQGFYWPTMVTDCEIYASRCEKCQRHAPKIHAPTELLTTSVAPYPFMRWAMDIVGPLPSSRQKKYMLIMTDYYTKWVEAEAYSNIRDQDVQRFVWKNIICRHGLPYEIVTDNGSQFTSTKFEAFCARWNIRLSKSTPRYPQGNGQAEATNKTILDGIKKRLDDKKGRWADELDGVLWSHRTTPRRATNQTPFFLSHGLEAMSPAEVSIPGLRHVFYVNNYDSNKNALEDAADFAEEMRDQALLRLQNYQQLAAQYYNRRVKSRDFEEGDLVLREVFENTREVNAGKLGAGWEGPYLVTKVVKPGVYELATTDGDPVPRSWNSNNLKRYHH